MGLLALCVGFSYEICHNGICDEDRCTSDDQCPSCFTCDTACGTCKTTPNCCMSHQVCPDWDGVCDATENPTTCNYCADDHLCTPGCIDNSNCEAGYQCTGHQCVEITTCTDDAFCNEDVSNICDIENSPYTTCFYCEGGECKPGCVTDKNCPGGYTCQAPLNAQLNGGTMVWQGAGAWTPRDICVDWMSDNFAWQCTTTPVGAGGKSWDLVDCHDLTPFTKCSNLTMTYML